MVLWALALVIFVMNLGFSIVIPIQNDIIGAVGGFKPDAAHELSLAIGAFFSIFNISKIIAQVPGGIVSDRFGDRRIVLLSALLYAVSLVILIEARDLGLLYLARILEGVATGISYPAATSIVMKHSAAERLGRNLGWQVFAGGIGFVLGPLLSDWILENRIFGLARDVYRPLRAMLWFTILGGGLAVFAFWRVGERERAAGVVEPPPEMEATITASEGLYAAQPGPALGKPSNGFLSGIVGEFKLLGKFAANVPLLFIVAPILVDKMMLNAFLPLIPLHGATLKLPPTSSVPSYLLGLLAATFAICQPIAGWLADRVQARRLVFANLLGLTGSLAALTVAWSLVSFVPFFFAYCVFASILMTVNLKLVGELYHNKGGQGRLFAVVGSVTDLGTVIGPMLYPWIHGFPNGGPSFSFLAMGATSAVAAVGFSLSAGREKDLPTV